MGSGDLPSARLRPRWSIRALGSPRLPENALALAAAALVLVQQAKSFPLEYLFVPDPEIWIAQVLAWLEILAPSGLAFVVVRRVLLRYSKWRRRPERGPGPAPPFPVTSQRVSLLLGSRYAPAVAGALTAAAMLYAWGGFRVPPVIHDEAAYLLQAQIYASGHWCEAPLPLPEFFDQLYVLTTPFHAAKYPPGFPLALVPGMLVGVPLLMPLAFTGLTGGLLFALSRRLANVWVAAIAWLLWTTTPWTISVPPPYMSQIMTQPLWLIGWWGLLRWVETNRALYLVLLALATGWIAIARPLTALAFAIPCGSVVVRLTLRRRSFGSFFAAVFSGALVVAILPLWNFEVTGSIRTSPLVISTKATTPYDQLGIGRTVPPATHELPPDLKRETRFIGHFSRHHGWRDLPSTIGSRASLLVSDAFGNGRGALIPFIAVGAFLSPGTALFAAGTSVLDFALYLLFPHPPTFTMYYMEVQTVLAFLVAVGLWNTLSFLILAPRSDISDPANGDGARALGLVFSCLVVAPLLTGLQYYHYRILANHTLKRVFQERISSIQKPAIVFVRYSPDHPYPISLVENGSGFEKQRIWIAYDLGDKNDQLMALAPDRAGYLYDEKSNVLISLNASRRPSGKPRRQ